MLTIRQTENGWEVVDGDGAVVACRPSYSEALTIIAEQLAQTVAAVERPTDEGLLAEVWESPITALAEPTGDGRDFSNVEWSWRDPTVSWLPLMLHTRTDMGHFGAELAGYIEQISEAGGTVSTRGRFYDSEQGRQLRDMLLGGRRFGVSVDPGSVEVEMRCAEEDDDGWCLSEEWDFLAYEVIGLTATPFPGFAKAYMQLAVDGAESGADDEEGADEEDDESGGVDDAEGDENEADEEMAATHSGCAECAQRAAEAQALVAARSVGLSLVASAGSSSELIDVPTEPPAEWFEDPGLPCPTPLTITNEGRVISHIAAWGTCHTGYDNTCVLPPESPDYDDFLQGSVLSAEGDRIRTGALTWGIPHADLSLAMIEAMAQYADSRFGWADVAVGTDAHGIWTSGALRPGLTRADLRILRSLALSGDWRWSRRVNGLSMIAALAVNHPGYPLPRSEALTAAAGRLPDSLIGPNARQVDGHTIALVAAGRVRPDASTSSALEQRIEKLEAEIARLRKVETAAPREALRAMARERLRSAV